MTDTDCELLASFVAAGDGAQLAFAELVRRHLDLVYRSARRQVRNEALAADIAQAVFVMLAAKAPALRPDVILPAWLMTATWYACRNESRKAQRRRIHERRVAMMRREVVTATTDRGDDGGDAMERVLDDALRSLREPERAAVVMHYLQGQGFDVLAAALHTTPEGARKRTERAVRKLRVKCARLGAEVAPAAVGAALTGAASSPWRAADALREQIVQSAAGSTGMAQTGAAAIAAAALQSMAAANFRTVAVAALTVLLAIGSGAAFVVAARDPRAAVPSPAVAAAATMTSAGPRDALTRLAAAVRNGDGAAAKEIAFSELPADRAFLDEAAETIRLVAELDAAYRARFGDAAAARLPTLDPRYVPADAPVIVEGERAVVDIDGWEIPMVNDAGAWKVPASFIWFSPFPREPFTTAGKAELTRRSNRVYAELTRAVAGGEIDTPEKALAELHARLDRVHRAVLRGDATLRAKPP